MIKKVFRSKSSVLILKVIPLFQSNLKRALRAIIKDDGGKEKQAKIRKRILLLQASSASD